MTERLLIRSIGKIAVKLQLRPKTVETYRENIQVKLGVHNSTELTRRRFNWVMEEP